LLQLGTADEPYEQNATITLHGDRYTTIEIPNIGAKCIAVSAKPGVMVMDTTTGAYLPVRNVGQLEVHGKKRLRTWTKLAQTANAGDSYIATSEKVDFAPGEVLIIPGSERDNLQYEEATVLSNADGYTVYLTAPLQFTHRSEIVHIEGRTVDLRCEVGLLTRNIVIQGEPVSSAGQRFGVHTVAMMSGIYRMENAEIRHCGQAFGFGRYCTHSHRAGNMEGSYVKANSIHHSFQRAVTTHDTDNWEVRDNVAYDITGHAYFVEDGSEKYNTISGNLGILIKQSSALLKSDMKPAVFWTSSPTNFWYDNVGVHSTHFGFWFELPSIENEGEVCSASEHLGAFKNNTVRSNGQIGMRIYPQYTPLVDPCDDTSDPAPQYFHNLLSYRNGGNGLFSKRHGDLHHIGHTLLENGGDEVSIVKYVRVGYTNDPTFSDCLFVGSLDKNFESSWDLWKFGLFAPQQGYFYVANSTFVNYGVSGALSGCNECLNGANMHQGCDTVRFKGLKFVNTTRRITWSPTKKEIFWDLDGTLGGLPNSMVLQWYDYNAWPECSRLPMAEFDDTMRCNSSVTVRKLAIDSVSPSQLSYTDITVKSAVGSSQLYFLPLDIYGWAAPIVSNHTYELDWADAGTSATQFRLTYGEVPYLKERIANHHVDTAVIQFSPKIQDYTPYSFDVTYGSKMVVSSLNETHLRNMSSSKYRAGTLSVLLSTYHANLQYSSPFQVTVVPQLCPPSGCYVPPIPTLGDPVLWSHPATWPSGYVPKLSEKVTITSTMWVVLDVTPPKLGCIYVYGKLSFLHKATANFTLTTYCMVVYGSVEIMGADGGAYEGTANIVLSGAIGASLPVTVGNGKYLGSKLIAVMGSFTAIGKSSNVAAWTQLNQTAYAGSTVVYLNSSVDDWIIGDEVVLSPTGYYGHNSRLWSASGGGVEIRKIVAIHHLSPPTKTVSYVEVVNDTALTELLTANTNLTILPTEYAAYNVTYLKEVVSYTNSSVVLTLNESLKQTHLCEILDGELFCGYVGRLSRSITIRSIDCTDTKSISYGYGGHIAVIDLLKATDAVSRNTFGWLTLENVALIRMGKINTDHYAVGFNYASSNRNVSSIVNCSFVSSYSSAVRAANTKNLIVSGNVIVGNQGGGVFIERSCSDSEVTGNLVVSTNQLSSVLKSTYPWVRPIAAYSIYSSSATVMNNVAAGSVDSGFAIAASLLTDRVDASVCARTRGTAYLVNASTILAGSSFLNNEAVACRTGVAIVTVNPQENSADDCAVLASVKVWRCAHIGIQAIDGKANILIYDAVLAENHIAVSLNFHKFSDDAFTGLVSSTVIGSLNTSSLLGGGGCNDRNDSSWTNICQSFSQYDPFGIQSSCQSVIAGSYKRVGILLPQFLDAPKTCAMAQRFQVCEPPSTPDRLCGMPWENRFGVPVK
jgi:hypothetical protein